MSNDIFPEAPTASQVYIEETLEDFRKRFVYHKPDGTKLKAGLNQLSRYQKIRDDAYALAVTILELTPRSREQSLAFTQLEEAVMWANSAIARRE